MCFYSFVCLVKKVKSNESSSQPGFILECNSNPNLRTAKPDANRQLILSENVILVGSVCFMLGLMEFFVNVTLSFQVSTASPTTTRREEALTRALAPATLSTTAKQAMAGEMAP